MGTPTVVAFEQILQLSYVVDRWLSGPIPMLFVASPNERSRRPNWPTPSYLGHILSIAMVDLDHFKSVNDRYSHQVGDLVLRAVADLFTSGLRSTDIVARYGGEEFVLVFPETSLAVAATIVEQVRETVERADWGAIRPGLTVTICAGVVSCRSHHSAPRLLAIADAMLYLAKERGRDQIRWREIGPTQQVDAPRDERVESIPLPA